ncbi:NAD(P)/FAD-dependent oxidoreductase [Patescibacteria group bacterium]|nr:NAD(P)/FAD-dependent oxidoreductase [Patescibacteria group bacterium]
MKNYDVIIVGSGIAGLECAKNLADSGLTILVIERKKQISRKICAEGVIINDLDYISKDLINFDFQKVKIHYKNKVVSFPNNGGIISTVNREKILNHRLESLKKFPNVSFLFGSSVSEIFSDNSLKLNSGEKLQFKFLVGADGSDSMVRRFLGLTIKKMEIAIQYIIPKRLDGFKVYLDAKLFGTGYLWIFPNVDYTSIGCGSDLRFIKPPMLKDNFDLWLKNNNFDMTGAKFEGALINYDYRGYKFGNIFLVGDASGLTSGILGKGINSAFLSGKQVAKDILSISIRGSNLIEKWTTKKRNQEKYMFFLRSPFLKGLFFSTVIRLLSHKKFKNNLEKIIKN